MQYKFDVSTFILAIVGLTVSLLIFAVLAPSVSNQLVASNYTSNATAGVLAPLVTVVFIAGILLRTLYVSIGKK